MPRALELVLKKSEREVNCDDREGELPNAHKGKGSARLLPEVTITLRVALCCYAGCLPGKDGFFPFLSSTQ